MKARNMRKQCTNLAILLSLSAGAQDWALFPLGIPQYYADSSAAPVTVDQYLMDSVREEGGAQLQFFNKQAWVQALGECASTLTDPWGYMDPWGMLEHWPKDSLIVRGDTVFKYSEYGSLPFYFLPHAAVGQAWTVISDFPGNGYDQITVTCTGQEQRSFLGITDSVKLFSLLPNGSLPGQVPISDFQIVLSKHHGLVEFVPFDLFLHHPAAVDFKGLELVGLDDGVNTTGFRTGLTEFFHLHAGDVLVWEVFGHPGDISQPETWTYWRDSIMTSVNTPDSVVYDGFRRIYDDNGLITMTQPYSFRLLKREFDGFFRGGTSTMVVVRQLEGYDPFNSIWGNYWGGPGVADVGHYEWWVDPLTMDTVRSWQLTHAGNWVDTLTCEVLQIADMVNNLVFDSRTGYSYKEFDSLTGTIIQWTLVGSIIDGVASGDFTVGMASTPAMATGAAVWPNPALDRIQVNLPDSGSPWSYALHDAMGREWGRGLLLADGVDVAQLPAGAYVLQAQAEGRVVNLRFVKQ
jgi:hypothetical protein